MPATEYGMTSRDYLARAASLRDSGDTADLLYAALELRCGIEARLHEYLRGAAKAAVVKKDLWQIKNLLREVESVVGVFDKAVVVTCTNNESGINRKLEYTPVTPSLKKVGEKLGNFLHYNGSLKNAAFKMNLSAIVDEGISGLKFATRGTLICPPLGTGDDNKQIHLIFEHGYTPDFLESGAKFRMKFKAVLLSKDNKNAIVKFAQE